jgi:hypothetical protein
VPIKSPLSTLVDGGIQITPLSNGVDTADKTNDEWLNVRVVIP